MVAKTCRFTLVLAIAATMGGCSQPLPVAPVEATVHPDLWLDITATPFVGRVDQDIRFEAAFSPDLGIIEVTWDFGDGTTGSGPLVDKAFDQAGEFAVRATAANATYEATDELYLLVLEAAPTEGTLTVRVQDIGGAVPGALVTVETAGVQATTDGDGAAGLVLEKGTHDVRVTHPDGRTLQDQATVEEGKSVDLVVSFADMPPPPLPRVFACPDMTVTEQQPTFGTDGGLMWAAQKSGFRAVIAWETSSPTAETIHVSVDGAPYEAVTETVPSTSHVFFLEGLPIGGTLCFQAPGMSTHALYLGNAMNAYDSTTGTYTLNLVVLDNEPTLRGILQAPLEDDLPDYARLLWDATDGHVRVGATLLIRTDPNRGYTHGFWTCSGWPVGLRVPTCDFMPDVYFSWDGWPQAAGMTNRDGITMPDGWIHMNNLWERGSVFVDDLGSVLAHELGHYAFGMMDLYTSASDCFDPDADLSLMGSVRGPTELDDEIHRCPNEASIERERGGYVPAWTSLRTNYPCIPDRAAILEGPEGDGGVFAWRSISAV